MSEKQAPGPRERMVVSTALLMRERGARATSIDQVLAHSGAPRGSIYHHFPGGREQLLREATTYAGGHVAERLQRHRGDPLAVVDWLVENYTRNLRETDFRAGCPIVAVAVESGGEGPDLRAEVKDAFDRWLAAIESSLVEAGVRRKRAKELAVSVLATAEGALILCRAYRDVAPLETVGRELRAQLAAELR